MQDNKSNTKKRAIYSALSQNSKSATSNIISKNKPSENTKEQQLLTKYSSNQLTGTGTGTGTNNTNTNLLKGTLENMEPHNDIGSSLVPEKPHSNANEKKIIFGGRFEVTPSRWLGKGSFGEIYLAQDNEDNFSYCALKIENRTKNSYLKIERNIIELTKGIEGFPKWIHFSSQGDSNFLAMEWLGPNWTELFDICKQRFTLQTTLWLAIQILTRTQELHSKNYLHRDIKPENFWIGYGNKSNVLYMIDFGWSKKYKDSKFDHLPYKEHRPLIGTTRYASINNHLGVEQSRRDDLESIGYIIIYFMRKRLPWQGCQGSTKQAKYNKILEKKLLISLDILCKDLPMEFNVYLNYVKNLKFDERPDYDFLKGLFTELLFSLYTEDFYYDWTWRYPDDAKNIRYEQMKIGSTKKEKEEEIEEKQFRKTHSKNIRNQINEEEDDDDWLIPNEESSGNSKTASDKTDEEDIINNFDGNEFLDIIQEAYKVKSKNNYEEVNSQSKGNISKNNSNNTNHKKHKQNSNSSSSESSKISSINNHSDNSNW